NSAVSSCRNHRRVDCVLVGVEYRLLLIHGWESLPESGGALATAVADVEGEDLACSRLHGNPDPLAVRLLAHQAPELLPLGPQPLQDHRRGTSCWLGMEIFGGCLKPRAHKLQEPLQPDAHRAADPPQRDSLQEEAFNEHALLLSDYSIFWMQDKGP